MTQAPGAAAQPAPAPATQAAPATPVVARVGAPQQLRKIEDVPQLLNRLQVLAVSACLIFGLAAALIQFLAWQAGDRAADNTEQLVRVQDIETSLYRADALASNAFLQGGLEPAEQRADYDATIDRVLTQIADAAEAQPADREALAALNAHVSAYTNAVTQARDNNRQAFPVGAAYLGEASTALRAGATPVLAALIEANTTRAEDEMEAQHPWWLLGLTVVVVAVLWLVNRSIARRFRRRFNKGLTLAAVAFIVLTFFTVSYASNQNSGIEELRDGDFELAVNEATARTAANDAKAKESARLIARSATDAAEEPWQAAAEIVDETTTFVGEWQAYKAAHQAVIELDNSGQWDAAVRLATRDPAGSTPAFDAFDASAENAVADAGDHVTEELRSNRLGIVLAVLTLVVGLFGAALAAWGINQRRKEYS